MFFGVKIVITVVDKESVMNLLTKTVAAALMTATVSSFAGSAGAAPLSASLALRNATAPAVETVQWRGGWRGGWGGWRGGGWGWGGAGIGLLAGAIIGGALASPYYGYGYGYPYAYGYGYPYSYAPAYYGYGYGPAYYGGYGYGYGPGYYRGFGLGYASAGLGYRRVAVVHHRRHR
jgi:hypothetical protein